MSDQGNQNRQGNGSGSTQGGERQSQTESQPQNVEQHLTEMDKELVKGSTEEHQAFMSRMAQMAMQIARDSKL